MQTPHRSATSTFRASLGEEPRIPLESLEVQPRRLLSLDSLYLETLNTEFRQTATSWIVANYLENGHLAGVQAADYTRIYTTGDTNEIVDSKTNVTGNLIQTISHGVLVVQKKLAGSDAVPSNGLNPLQRVGMLATTGQTLAVFRKPSYWLRITTFLEEHPRLLLSVGAFVQRIVLIFWPLISHVSELASVCYDSVLVCSLMLTPSRIWRTSKL